MKKGLATFVAGTAASAFLYGCGTESVDETSRLRPGIYSGEVRCESSQQGRETFYATIVVDEEGLPVFGSMHANMGSNVGLPLFAGNLNDLLSGFVDQVAFNTSQTYIADQGGILHANHSFSTIVRDGDYYESVTMANNETFTSSGSSSLKYGADFHLQWSSPDSTVSATQTCSGDLR